MRVNGRKQGKTRVTKLRLVLVLHLIGWEGGTSFLVQSQSIVKAKPMRVSQGGPCSLVPFQNCPMFPCSHTLSECFHTVIFRILFPCSQKLANVPLFPSIFCQCSLVPQNHWETLTNAIPDYFRNSIENCSVCNKIYQLYCKKNSPAFYCC